MSEDGDGDVLSVVVTFKCSPKFKDAIDEFARDFDSRSDLIRESIKLMMLEQGFGDSDESRPYEDIAREMGLRKKEAFP